MPADAMTSIVLPAYDEAQNLPVLVAELIEIIDDQDMTSYQPVEIIIVDDGSTDNSQTVLRELAAEHNILTALLLSRNFGQSAALAAGIDYASGSYIVTMDADRQNDPADVPSLLERLQSGYDCVSGWRRNRNDPLSKTVPSKIQTYLARKSGPDLHDFGCTLKAYRAEALRAIELYGEGHRYIPAKLHKKGFSMAEQEVSHRPRTEGSTKYGWRRLLKGFMDLLFHIFWNRYSTRPLHLLGSGGILLMGIGSLIGIHAVFIKYIQDVSLIPKLPRLILVTALMLFGLQLVMFGFIAEMITKIHYAEETPYMIHEIVSD
jgi:glycosyltransferase involved in cell wall biosynthesis